MIFAILARWGVPQRLIAPLLWLGAAAVLALCVALWFRSHNRQVIDRHEAEIAKQVTEATTAANETANTNDTKRQADNARADEQLRGAITDAEAKHPEEVRRDAGPATRSTLERLRQRAPSPGPAAGR